MIRLSEMTPEEASEAGKGRLHEIQGYPVQSGYANLRTYIFVDSLGVVLARILRIVWLAGIAVVGLTLLLSNLNFSRKLRKTRIRYQTDNCERPVYLVENLSSPCLFGLFHPAIYITPEVAGDALKLNHVLVHEQTHYRHGDHIWAAMRGFCLAIHWYNPLVWLAATLSRRDSEQACDEGTIKHLGEANRLEYGRTIIGLTCEIRKTMNLLCCATTMSDGEQGIRERITLIARKPKVFVPALVAVVLVTAVAVGCTFTGAKSEKANDSIKSTVTKWFDGLHGDEMIWDSVREINLEAFPDVTFRCHAEKLEAVTENEIVPLFTGMPIWNVYFCDLTGDGKPELCSTISIGSGIIDNRIIIHNSFSKTIHCSKNEI